MSAYRDPNILCKINMLTRAGFNMNQIAKRTDYSRERIRQILYVKHKSSTKKTRHDRVHVALRLRWQGYAWEYIQEYVDVSHVQLLKWRREVISMLPANFKKRRRRLYDRSSKG